MSYKVFTNTNCEFYPCHDINQSKYQFNCMFCFCPLYFLDCPGNYQWIEDHQELVKDCSNCKLPHLGKNGHQFVVNNINRPFIKKPSIVIQQEQGSLGVLTVESSHYFLDEKTGSLAIEELKQRIDGILKL